MVTDTMDLASLGWSVSRTGDFERPGYFSIRVATLPPGHDPDSLLRAEGGAALAARLDAARPLLAFVLDRALAEEDLATARGRATAHARIALLLSKVANAEEATALSREAARRLGVDATQLWIESQRLQGARARGRRVEPPAAPTAFRAPALAERDLLAFLLHVPEARAELLPILEDVDVAHEGLRILLAALRRASGAPEALMSLLEGEAERSLLASLLMDDRKWGDTHSHIFELRKRYHIRRRRERVRQVSEAIARAQATGDPAVTTLQTELRELQREAEAVRELAVARPDPEPGGRAGR
jgi:DNA primase